jgi:hypothetical protein
MFRPAVVEEFVVKAAELIQLGDAVGGAVWDVTFMNGQWLCSCPARSKCSHLIATGLVVAPEVGP